MAKPKIFIGCSTERLNISKELKKTLEAKIDATCTIWDHFGVFKMNKSSLESLLKGRFFYDFVILIATKDDSSWIRRKLKKVPRDNVIFEFGLYIGALGDSRTFILQEDGTNLPSDLRGLTVPRFSVKRNNLTAQIEQFSSVIQESLKHPEVQILPSTSLAVGYFNSFIKDVTHRLFNQQKSLTIEDTIHPCEKMIIVIPTELSDNISEKASVFYTKYNLKITEIESISKRPFKIQYAYERADISNVRIIDMPTTLNTIRPCCLFLLGSSNVGISDDQQLIEKKEVANFKHTLELLIEQHDYSKDIVKVIWEEDFTL